MTEAYNIDCMEYMKTVPDKFFDLAIVDVPYGDGLGGNATTDGKNEVGCHYGMNGRGRGKKYFREEKPVERTGGTWASKYGKSICDWDVAPSDEYFKELFRVSKNQIIWGGQLL